MKHPLVVAFAAMCLAVVGGPRSLASDRQWTNERFGGAAGFDDAAYAILDLQTHPTPTFLVAGEMRRVGVVESGSTAYFDGTNWHAASLDGGRRLIKGRVFSIAFATIDGIRRPTLASGTSLAFWDGEGWLGEREPTRNFTGTVLKLYEHDDGSGTTLYAGGRITKAAGVDVHGVIRLNEDSGWEQVGLGLNGDVRSFLTIQRHGQAILLAGGSFGIPGYSGFHEIAQWDGESWTPFGDVFWNGEVKAMIEFDDGTGNAIYAGGAGLPAFRIEDPPGTYLGPRGLIDVQDFAIFDSGNGPELFAAGLFTRGDPDAPARNSVVRWTGQEWVPTEVGENLGFSFDRGTFGLLPTRVGSTPMLVAAGREMRYATGGRISGVAGWDGEVWQPLTSGLSWLAAQGDDLHALDADRAMVAGRFTHAGLTPLHGLALWNGRNWEPLGDPVPGANAGHLTRFTEGGVMTWVVGGNFELSGTDYNAVKLVDDKWQPAVFAGWTPDWLRGSTDETSPPGGVVAVWGRFERGSDYAEILTRVDGLWRSAEGIADVESAIAIPTDASVRMLAAGGTASTPETPALDGVFEYNQALNEWALVLETDREIDAFEWYGDPTSPRFAWIKGSGIYIWDGLSDAPAQPTGTARDPYALFGVMLDGVRTLIVAGRPDDVTLLYRLDGTSLVPLDPHEVIGVVTAIQSVGEAGNETLWFGGSITVADTPPSSLIARWGPAWTLQQCPADIATDGTADGGPDGLVTLSDFVVYLGRWGRHESSADLTQTGTSSGLPDGAIDLSDFSYYLSLWTAGCP